MASNRMMVGAMNHHATALSDSPLIERDMRAGVMAATLSAVCSRTDEDLFATLTSVDHA